MARGMYLNSNDLSFISQCLWGEISTLRVILKNNNDKRFVNDFDKAINLYCKINKLSMEQLDKIFYYIDIFVKYSHVKSYGVIQRFEKIYSIEPNAIYTENGSFIGWGIYDESVFVKNTFYPYGIDRKDVFLEFKSL